MTLLSQLLFDPLCVCSQIQIASGRTSPNENLSLISDAAHEPLS